MPKYMVLLPQIKSPCVQSEIAVKNAFLCIEANVARGDRPEGVINFIYIVYFVIKLSYMY